MIAAGGATQVECHFCPSHRWLGEAPANMVLVGVFRYPDARMVIPEPRMSWRCHKCGWTTVWQPAPSKPNPSWRSVELKTG